MDELEKRKLGLKIYGVWEVTGLVGWQGRRRYSALGHRANYMITSGNK